MYPQDEQLWLDAFDQKIKTKSFEAFSLLLCDFSRAPDKQKVLLNEILFKDHCSATYWAAYIEYACKTFPTRKLQLQRLINKGLELLDEAIYKNDKDYLIIHINLANLKGSIEETIRYFQNNIYKRNIGTKSASLYVSWADASIAWNGAQEGLLVLNKAVEADAEPKQTITKKLKEIKLLHEKKQNEEEVAKTNIGSSKSLTLFDDGEVKFNKKVDVHSFHI